MEPESTDKVGLLRSLHGDTHRKVVDCHTSGRHSRREGFGHLPFKSTSCCGVCLGRYPHCHQCGLPSHQRLFPWHCTGCAPPRLLPSDLPWNRSARRWMSHTVSDPDPPLSNPAARLSALFSASETHSSAHHARAHARERARTCARIAPLSSWVRTIGPILFGGALLGEPAEP